MATIGNVRIVVCFVLDICHCSATTELLETVTHLLTGCLRFYPYANRNTAENLIVRFEVTLDSARLVNSFERDDQVNAGRIPHFESLVRQLQILLKLMGNVRNKSSFMYLSPKSGHLLCLSGNFKKLLLLFMALNTIPVRIQLIICKTC